MSGLAARVFLVGTVVCVGVGAAPATAFAQGTDNSAAVEALFTEGKRLEGEGRFAQACPKFLASYNLEHRVGTLVNLVTNAAPGLAVKIDGQPVDAAAFGAACRWTWASTPSKRPRRAT